MTITTNKGKTVHADWAWAEEGALRIELPNALTVREAVEEYDGLQRVERASKNEGNVTYEGYSVLTKVIVDRKRGKTILVLEKE